MVAPILVPVAEAVALTLAREVLLEASAEAVAEAEDQRETPGRPAVASSAGTETRKTMTRLELQRLEKAPQQHKDAAARWWVEVELAQ